MCDEQEEVQNIIFVNEEKDKGNNNENKNEKAIFHVRMNRIRKRKGMKCEEKKKKTEEKKEEHVIKRVKNQEK